MGALHARRFAALEFGLVAVLVVAMVALSLGREPLFDTLLFGFIALALAAAGALIVTRRPGHPIGWLFCALAMSGAVAEFADGWGLSAPDLGLPAGLVGEWVTTWSWILDGTLWTLVFLAFPSGWPGSRWERGVGWLAVAGGALALPGYALGTRTDSLFLGGENPYGVGGPAADAVAAVGATVLIVALVAAVAAFLLRLRRARGIERQQLKWFACAAAVVGAVLPLALVFWGRSPLISLLTAVALTALPVTAGSAILRYRLYDIDRILNRAAVYALLTALLAGVYGVSVLLPAQVFGRTGDEPSWLVAGATLAVAALFQPARRRIQHAVDRRFNRRRYDAAQTIAAFNARLRDEVDLDTLSAELRAVVERTMQPAAVSTWLRTARS